MPHCPTPRWVNLKEAAALADVDETTMLRWCQKQQVHARKVGGTVWRVRIDDDNLPADPPDDEERAP